MSWVHTLDCGVCNSRAPFSCVQYKKERWCHTLAVAYMKSLLHMCCILTALCQVWLDHIYIASTTYAQHSRHFYNLIFFRHLYQARYAGSERGTQRREKQKDDTAGEWMSLALRVSLIIGCCLFTMWKNLAPNVMSDMCLSYRMKSTV